MQHTPQGQLSEVQASLFEIMEQQLARVLSPEDIDQLLEQHFLKLKDQGEIEVDEDFPPMAPLADLAASALYEVIHQGTAGWVASILPHMTPEQRQIVVDIDAWKKDRLNLSAFTFWPKVYSLCTEPQLVEEFFENGTLLTYLKGVFHISTFDVEEPVYPDHDRYFLTDDQLLIFEYDDYNACVEEVQHLIRVLYSQRGVENAYTFLFKLVSESFMIFEEEEFRQASERLRDMGFVDYYHSLELLSVFPSERFLTKWIKDKFKGKQHQHSPIDDRQKIQTSTMRAIHIFQQTKDNHLFSQSLMSVEDPSRFDYLRFNLVRLLNACLIQQDGGRKEGKQALQCLSATRAFMQLGFSYLYQHQQQIQTEQKNLWDYVDGTEMAKIGRSLVHFEQEKVKKALALLEQDQEECDQFLGQSWRNQLEGLFAEVPYVENEQETKLFLNNLSHFELLRDQTKQLIDFIPYMKKFVEIFRQLKKRCSDEPQTYLNYHADSLDWECLFLTSFMLFMRAKVGLSSGAQQSSLLGLNAQDRKQLIDILLLTEERYLLSHRSACYQFFLPYIKEFLENYGLNLITRGEDYLFGLIQQHLMGLDYPSLTDEDYRHVGGILLFSY
jgi:hypothetical protein